MGLRDIGERLPPGFRFHPSDEELVCHYLHKKILNEESLLGTFIDIDLHTCEPWQLPQVAKLNSSEWYFFNFRDRKYATGFRTNRATTSGYWKATGKDRVILDPNTNKIVGMRKTLVFYRNRAPNGIKSGWIMHEFRLENPHMPPKEDWVLCRVFHKGKGKENNNNHHYYTTPCGCQQHSSISSSNNIPLIPQNKPMIGNNIMDIIDRPNRDNGPIYPNNNNNNNNVLSLNPNNSFIQLVKDDDYGFLLDMDLEENSKLGEGVPMIAQHGGFENVDEDDSTSTFFI